MIQVIVEPVATSNVKKLLRSAVENELKILGLGINKTKKELSRFEKKFEMESSLFYEQYQDGSLGDNMDYIRWAGEYETLQRLKQDHRDLQEIEIC